jgi:hypothetical protein
MLREVRRRKRCGGEWCRGQARQGKERHGKANQQCLAVSGAQVAVALTPSFWLTGTAQAGFQEQGRAADGRRATSRKTVAEAKRASEDADVEGRIMASMRGEQHERYYIRKAPGLSGKI